MADVLRIRLNRTNDIALHDLHVIDVVEELDAWRSDPLHHGDAEGRMIALIVGVIDLAVEELDADGDALLLGECFDGAQSLHARRDGVEVAAAVPVAEHRDHVRHASARGERDRRFELAQEHAVVCRIVESGWNEVLTFGRVAHRADESRVAHDRPILGLEEVDAGEPHRLRGATELRERDLGVRPAGDGLLEPAGPRHVGDRDP